MDLKLYQITNGFMEVNKIDNDLTEQEKSEMNKELCEALQTKSTNIIGYYKNESALLDGIKAEIERLKTYKGIVEGRIDRYKEYVKSNMEVLGIKKIETELGTLSIANSPIKVEIIDKEKVPAEFKKVIQDIQIDKKAIADNFKETGEIPEGVNIQTENKSLRIK